MQRPVDTAVRMVTLPASRSTSTTTSSSARLVSVTVIAAHTGSVAGGVCWLVVTLQTTVHIRVARILAGSIGNTATQALHVTPTTRRILVKTGAVA